MSTVELFFVRVADDRVGVRGVPDRGSMSLFRVTSLGGDVLPGTVLQALRLVSFPDALVSSTPSLQDGLTSRHPGVARSLVFVERG